MILTCKRLLVDIFRTCRLSKSLTFCEFASINFELCNHYLDLFGLTHQIDHQLLLKTSLDKKKLFHLGWPLQVCFRTQQIHSKNVSEKGHWWI